MRRLMLENMKGGGDMAEWKFLKTVTRDGTQKFETFDLPIDANEVIVFVKYNGAEQANAGWHTVCLNGGEYGVVSQYIEPNTRLFFRIEKLPFGFRIEEVQGEKNGFVSANQQTYNRIVERDNALKSFGIGSDIGRALSVNGIEMSVYYR